MKPTITNLQRIQFISGNVAAVAPLPVEFPEGAQFGGWDPETLTLTYTVPPVEEGAEPTEESVTLTQEQIDSAYVIATTPDILELPLRERLKSVTEGFPAALKAAFPFERVAYWLDQGDAAAAKAVIEAVDVSSFPQDVQDAHSALLAQFD